VKSFPPSAGDGDSGAKAIEQAAANWLALHDRGLLPAQEAQFRRWLEADERNARIFAQMRQTWTLLDDVSEAKTTSGWEAEIDRLPRRPTSIRGRAPLALALAAAAAIAFAYMGSSRRPYRVDTPFLETAATEVGRMETLNLPDGSVVQLNTDSAVDVRFSASERGIALLRGEAHFIVARNPARPFIVSADKVAVRAVGTAFNVRLRADAVEVLVTEGQVDVDPGAPLPAARSTSSNSAVRPLPPRLTAGQKATIPFTPPASTGVEAAFATVAPVAREEIGRALAWREQKLEFVSVPLADIVAEFNRYNRTKFVIPDAELAARHFGGTFKADDPDTFVHLLKTTFDVVADRRGQEIALSLKR
jgi:transmembrane sensor